LLSIPNSDLPRIIEIEKGHSGVNDISRNDEIYRRAIRPEPLMTMPRLAGGGDFIIASPY
jgi:hypothetical protein